MNETNEAMAADNCPTFEGLEKQARVPGGRFQFLINDIPWLMSINIRGANLQVHTPRRRIARTIGVRFSFLLRTTLV